MNRVAARMKGRLVGEFYDFNWGEAGDSRARLTAQLIDKPTANIKNCIGVVLMASVITSRGRLNSPSAPLEGLTRASEPPTDVEIQTGIYEAYNELEIAFDRVRGQMRTVQELVTPQHRIATECSDTLIYSLQLANEKILDLTAAVLDLGSGWRGLMIYVFGVAKPLVFSAYLQRGLKRSRLKETFGDSIKEPPESDEE